MRYSRRPLARFLRLALLAVAALLVLPPARAVAHRDDYIDETFVYTTLQHGEREIELWGEWRNDAQHQTQDWFTAAFEYGITSRWTLDGAAQWLVHRGNDKLGRIRTETRYRFAEEGAWPIDLAVSVEYEHEAATTFTSESENTITPRLVLSRDLVTTINTTLNLDFPIRLGQSGNPGFAYALGIRYPAESFIRIGTELKGEPDRHVLTLFPQIWFALPHEATFKVGTGIGLTRQTDRFLGRLVFEIEF